jgi:hypothetical protein
MVPEAEFASYYGRPILKAPVWQERDIAGYLFLGGLAGGSSLLAAGADLTGRPGLRKASRFGALVALTGSFAALVHDLGRPARFLNMLRVAKPTSPMSVGTWILTAYGPMAGLAAASEVAELLPLPGVLRRLVSRAGRPAGLVAAGFGPGLASYTAALLADTAVPAWHEHYRELPFVFVGSAAAASGGLALLAAPIAETGPARRLAAGGALLELAASRRMEHKPELAAEPLREGRPGQLLHGAQGLTAAGALLALAGRRSRVVSAAAGAALLAGSALTRFGVFEAGVASAKDPKYTVVPQRQRLDARG